MGKVVSKNRKLQCFDHFMRHPLTYNKLHLIIQDKVGKESQVEEKRHILKI